MITQTGPWIRPKILGLGATESGEKVRNLGGS
jgi:hypothetical protein